MNESERPLVSICCMTYNQENFIKDCLEGFLIQKTNFKFEILINDDASTDQTAQIVREYENKYPHLIRGIYQNKNLYSQGIRITMHILYPQAKGKYVALCEGDDYWTDPYKLQKQVDLMEQNPDLSMCAHAANSLICGVLDEIKLDKTELTINDIISDDWGIMTASILFRKDMLVMPEWYGKIKHGDYGLQLLLSLKGNIGYLPDNMSVYRQHFGGVSSKINPLNQAAWLSYLLDEFNKYTDYKYKQLIKNKIHRMFRNQITFSKQYQLRKQALVLEIYSMFSSVFPFAIKKLRK